MAQGKFTEKVIRLRCATCKHTNYMTRKNKKTIQKKLEFKKYCPFCKKQTPHKESKK